MCIPILPHLYTINNFYAKYTCKIDIAYKSYSYELNTNKLMNH
jgi:hypothetical protein